MLCTIVGRVFDFVNNPSFQVLEIIESKEPPIPQLIEIIIIIIIINTNSTVH